MATHKIGLLLGDEEDWPSAFEALHRRLRRPIQHAGESHEIDVERVRIHPFGLRDSTSYSLIIDRLAYWHFNPREWLKKVAMLNNVYMLNNPFTFQSMEKHTAYCAMIRLGLNIPETFLIPAKRGPKDKKEKYDRTAKRYHDLFDLRAIARKVGYPLYMKPFDGGGWRGVTKVSNDFELMKAYDESGEDIMHVQRGLDPFQVFFRALAFGPQVMVMKYDPAKPMHARYCVEFGFLGEKEGKEAIDTVKLINAFFRWEFNSCESILKDGAIYPIDYANACPDIAITSLHFYFPWAISALWKWSTFCAVTKRQMKINLSIDDFFSIADSGGTLEEKMLQYNKLVDKYFETDKFNEFSAKHFGHVDEAVYDFIDSREFDDILVQTVMDQFPQWEHEKFISHYRGIMNFWKSCNAKKQPELPAPAENGGAATKPAAPAAAKTAAPSAKAADAPKKA